MPLVPDVATGGNVDAPETDLMATTALALCGAKIVSAPKSMAKVAARRTVFEQDDDNLRMVLIATRCLF